MFLSLIFSFQNHREYYKNCTNRQPGGLYAPLSVPERRSTPHFHAVFSPPAQSCPIPGVDILAERCPAIQNKHSKFYQDVLPYNLHIFQINPPAITYQKWYTKNAMYLYAEVLFYMFHSRILI